MVDPVEVVLSLLAAIRSALRTYEVVVSARYLMYFFPQANTFTQPMATITKMAQPFVESFRGLVPKILGHDFSPVMGFFAIRGLIQILSDIINFDPSEMS